MYGQIKTSSPPGVKKTYEFFNKFVYKLYVTGTNRTIQFIVIHCKLISETALMKHLNLFRCAGLCVVYL